MAQPPSPLGSNVFIFVRGLVFSPDGSELAALMQGQEARFRLVVWDAKGTIVEDHDLGLQIGGGYNDGDPIQWSPGGSSWLLHGDYLFDRRLGAIVWILRPPVMHHYPHRFLDADQVIATRGDFQVRELIVVPVPRDEIQGAVESLNSGRPARLRPGDEIALQVKVGDIRYSNKAEVETSLRDVIGKRLTDAGLLVADGGPLTLQVTYSEAQGNELRVMEGGPFRSQQRDTGQRVEETVGVLEARLTREGEDQPFWETTARRGNPHFVRQETITDAVVRKAMFDNIQYLIRTTPFPYFVPADPDAPSLPIIAAL
jgi:hypothetical protein